MNLYDLVMNMSSKMTKSEFAKKIRSEDEDERKAAIEALAEGYDNLLED